MSEKEKLVKLLQEAHEAYYAKFDPSVGYFEALADRILSAGVMPPEEVRSVFVSPH
jgi:hypothetical protein